MCIKMQLENRINTTNGWDLKIIDYMEVMLQRGYDDDKDLLSLGTRALDVITDVYALRVDDIYSEGLKLASLLNSIGDEEDSGKG